MTTKRQLLEQIEQQHREKLQRLGEIVLQATRIARRESRSDRAKTKRALGKSL